MFEQFTTEVIPHWHDFGSGRTCASCQATDFSWGTYLLGSEAETTVACYPCGARYRDEYDWPLIQIDITPEAEQTLYEAISAQAAELNRLANATYGMDGRDETTIEAALQWMAGEHALAVAMVGTLRADLLAAIVDEMDNLNWLSNS
jgi:hypothetical protein